MGSTGRPATRSATRNRHTWNALPPKMSPSAELVVAQPDRRDAGRDLGQRRGEREHGRAEDDAVHARPVGQHVAPTSRTKPPMSVTTQPAAKTPRPPRAAGRRGARVRLLAHRAVRARPGWAPGMHDLPARIALDVVQHPQPAEPGDDDRDRRRAERADRVARGQERPQQHLADHEHHGQALDHRRERADQERERLLAGCDRVAHDEHERLDRRSRRSGCRPRARGGRWLPPTP